MLQIYFILTISCLLSVNGGHQYKVIKNTAVANLNDGVVSSFTKASKDDCLSECNSKSSCLTALYIKSLKVKNCFLFDKYFKSNEIKFLKNSNLYSKKRKQTKIIEDELFIKLVFNLQILALKFKN